MSHLGARILAVLREERPYELRDTQGNRISREEARRLILSKYKVPEEIRRERRRRNRRKSDALKPGTKNRGVADLRRMHEAASAPQPGIAPAIPRQLVYLVGAKKSS